MLSSQEIRPGNYLEVKDSNGWIIEAEYTFKKDGIWWASYNGGCSRLENMLPLEITEERLLKLGFEYDNGYYMIESFMLGRKNNSIFGNERYYFPNDDFILEPKHIHRLQNLYYELTDKELKWK